MKQPASIKSVTGFKTSDGSFFEHIEDARYYEAVQNVHTRIQTSMYFKEKPTLDDITRLVTSNANVFKELCEAWIERDIQKTYDNPAEPDDYAELDLMTKGKTKGKTNATHDPQQDAVEEQDEVSPNRSRVGRDGTKRTGDESKN